MTGFVSEFKITMDDFPQLDDFGRCCTGHTSGVDRTGLIDYTDVIE